MKTLLLAFALIGLSVQGPTLHSMCAFPMTSALYAQQGGPPMPPSGNPDHQEPAPGASCHHAREGSPDSGHDCACHRECKENDDGTLSEVEDSQCRAWCFKDRCACPTACP